MSSELPKIWKKPKRIEPQYYVRFNHSRYLAVICTENGELAQGGRLLRLDGIRENCVAVLSAQKAGVILDERSQWDKDQCIETLSRYIKENMQ